jgi:tRNA pseudouridine55 synthase
VGHAGTLDPIADGVLPVLLGRATRLATFVQAGRKTYRAVVCLGRATDTDDAEGAITSVAAIPPLSESCLNEVLAGFEGQILQTPPRYSALKVGGRRAYAVARAGGKVDAAPRPITIHQLDLVGWTPTELTLEVVCSKGTYVRALARDIAAALGTVGHLTALTRTRVGCFLLDKAVTLDEVSERGVDEFILPAVRAIPDAPIFSVYPVQVARLANGQVVTADPDQIARLANGQSVTAAGLRADAVWVYDPDGLLVCLASADGTRLQPRLLL